MIHETKGDLDACFRHRCDGVYRFCRRLVVAFPTMALAPGHLATEDDAPDPSSAGGRRATSEEVTLSMASRGIRASVVRLPPAVHDREKQGLASMMIRIAQKNGVSAYVEDGHNRWPAVHRLDAARLFRLALEKGSAGPGITR